MAPHRMLCLLMSVVATAAATASASGNPEGGGGAGTVRVAMRDSLESRVSRYAMAILEKANERLGWTVATVGERNHGEYVWTKAGEVDVVSSALYTPEIAARYVHIPQALGSVRISLFAKPDTKAMLACDPPHAWPHLRMAYARGVLDPIGEFQNWCDRKAVTSIVDVCYPTREDAEKAVRSGECSLLLTSAAETIEGLEAVETLRRLPCFMAVSRRRPDLQKSLAAELERLSVYDMAAIDGIRRRILGEDRSEKRVIVARCIEDGYSWLMPDGTFAGANEEIIERIAKLNGWRVDWVTCDCERALAYLAEGRIDLLAGVAMNEERLGKFHFPHVPCGATRSFLYTRPGSPFRAQRFEGWHGMDVATGPDSQDLAGLKGFLDARGVRYSVTSYPTPDEAEKAYYQGRHTVLHAIGTHRLDSEKQLAAFSLVPSYVCCPKDRPELISALERTLVRIGNETPGFFEDVKSRHFVTDEMHDTSLSPEEHAWIRSCVTAGSVVRVDISPLVPPLKDWDSASGQPRGFINAFFEELTRRSGLHFMFLPPASELVARRRLLDGESDILVSFGADLSEFDRADIIGSVKLNMVLACRRAVHPGGIDPTFGRIAVPAWNRTTMQALRNEAVGSYLLSRPDAISCFRAVRDGEADCAYATVFTALACMRELGLEREFETRRVIRGRRTMDLALVASSAAEPELRSALSKTLGSFDAAQIEAFISRTLYESSRRPFVSLPGVFTLAFAFVALMAVGWTVRRTRVMIRQRRGIIRLNRMLADRDEALRKTFDGIRAPLDAIEARAEYLRTPNASREHVLQWTEELIRSVENIVGSLNRFMDRSGRSASGDGETKSEGGAG